MDKETTVDIRPMSRGRSEDVNILSGPFNNARTVVLHGPPGVGKSTAVQHYKKTSPAGVVAFDAEDGGVTKEERQAALASLLSSNGKAQGMHFAVIGSADLSAWLMQVLPRAKHLLIMPDEKTHEERHKSRTSPLKLAQDWRKIRDYFLGDPMFDAMERVDDPVTAIEDHLMAYPKPKTGPPLSDKEVIERIGLTDSESLSNRRNEAWDALEKEGITRGLEEDASVVDF